MENNKLKTIFISISILLTNFMFSQCPIRFPKLVDVCLEDTLPYNSICLKNSEGNLKLLLNGSSTTKKELFSFDKNGNFEIGNNQDGTYSKLIISGPNQSNFPVNANSPQSYRDISYEFNEAGSAKIRSFRGGTMDTYLQFLTNANNPSLNDPQIRMHINEDGKIGIGTVTPKAQLDVNGNLKMGIKDDSNDLTKKTAKLIIQGANYPYNSITNPSNYRDISYEFTDAGSAKIRSFRGGAMDTYLQFLTNAHVTNGLDNPQVRMHINGDGNIGIGTVAPQALLDVRNGKVLICDSNNIPSLFGDYRLYVTGGILSEKFKAALTSSTQWADHVFYKDYKLKPLEEVEQYILANKHLPNIPSAEEIIKDGGIDLAQMQAKQMEKIEELTLYMIEMKKEIEALKKQNKELKEKYKNN